jgi:hypothetical protein
VLGLVQLLLLDENEARSTSTSHNTTASHFTTLNELSQSSIQVRPVTARDFRVSRALNFSNRCQKRTLSPCMRRQRKYDTLQTHTYVKSIIDSTASPARYSLLALLPEVIPTPTCTHGRSPGGKILQTSTSLNTAGKSTHIFKSA